MRLDADAVNGGLGSGLGRQWMSWTLLGRGTYALGFEILNEVVHPCGFAAETVDVVVL